MPIGMRRAVDHTTHSIVPWVLPIGAVIAIEPMDGRPEFGKSTERVAEDTANEASQFGLLNFT